MTETTAQEKNIADELQYNMASGGKRFANYILDVIFIYIFSAIIGIIMGIVIALAKPEWLSVFDEENKLAEYLMGFFISMFYYSILESATGRSIAKFITGTKVINYKGETPGFGTILIRTLCRFIPFEPFSFLGGGASGWHDTISKTKVVNVK